MTMEENVNFIEEIRKSSITISSFPSAVTDYKWLLEKSTKTTSCHQGVFEWFFKVNYIHYDEMPDYMCIPVQCEILHNYRLRHIIVTDSNGVMFLCILKLIDPINIQTKTHFVLAYRPLPNIPDSDNSDVIKALALVGVDKMIVVGGDNPFNWNFYNNREEASKMMTSKWRSKHGVNKINEMITVETSTSSYKDGIKNLLIKWEESKGHGGTKNHIKCSEMDSSDILRHRVYVVNGVVVGYAAITMFCGNPFVMISKHAGQCNIIDDKFICDHIGDYMIYDMHKMMLEDENSSGLYYFGSNRGKNKTSNTLEQYKRKIFKRTVPYSYELLTP